MKSTVFTESSRELHRQYGSGVSLAAWNMQLIRNMGFAEGRHYIFVSEPRGRRYVDVIFYTKDAIRMMWERSAKQGPKLGTLYVLWSERMKAVKIGRTTYSVETRMRSLRCGYPDLQMVQEFQGMGHKEGSVMWELREHHIGGEWFEVLPEVAISAVERVIAD